MVKRWKPLRNSQSKTLNFFHVPRISPSAHPLTKKPEDSRYDIDCKMKQKKFKLLGEGGSWEVLQQNTFHGGGMDIFWNNTFSGEKEE